MTEHVFEIDIDVWNAIAADEIDATVDAMRELEIYKLPFDEGEIVFRVRHHDDGNASGYYQVTEVRGLRDHEEFCEFVLHYPKKAKGNAGLKAYKRFVQNLALQGEVPTKWTEPDCKMVDAGIYLEGKRVVHKYRCFHQDGPSISKKMHRDALIVILASKGTEKCVRHNKIASLGIGKKGGEYVTTIKLASNLGTHESVGCGRPVRPHLRRGHIRTQHHGPQNSLTKRIWIDPCFVNADADFVSQRKAYRVVH